MSCPALFRAKKIRLFRSLQKLRLFRSPQKIGRICAKKFFGRLCAKKIWRRSKKGANAPRKVKGRKRAPFFGAGDRT